MADEEMLDDGFGRGGEAVDFVDGAADGFELHHDVAEKLAGGGVTDGAHVAELFELADVVKDGGGEQEIDVELGVMRGDAASHAAQGDDVLEQSTEIGVVHDFGGGGALVAARNFGVGDDGGGGFLRPRMGDGWGGGGGGGK